MSNGKLTAAEELVAVNKVVSIINGMLEDEKTELKNKLFPGLTPVEEEQVVTLLEELSDIASNCTTGSFEWEIFTKNARPLIKQVLERS